MKTLKPIIAFFAVLGIVAQAQADHHLKPVKLDGVWKVSASMDGGEEREYTWTFKKDGDKFSGISLDHENDDERDFESIKVKEKKVVIEMEIEGDGQEGVIRIEGEEKSPGKLVGKWSVVDTPYEGDFVAMREVDFAGEWDAVSVLPDGQGIKSVLKLMKKSGKMMGVLDGQAGKIDLDKVSVKDGKLHVEFAFEMQGNEIEVSIDAKPEGDDKLVGEWSVPDGGGTSGDWSAKRKSPLAGAWKYMAVVPDGDQEGDIMFAMKDGKLSGTSKGPDGDATKMDKIAFDGKKLMFSVPFERDGVEGIVNIEAKVQKDGSLDGEWILVGGDGNEYARDSWKAKRSK